MASSLLVILRKYEFPSSVELVVAYVSFILVCVHSHHMRTPALPLLSTNHPVPVICGVVVNVRLVLHVNSLSRSVLYVAPE